jgi:hypothetical protein
MTEFDGNDGHDGKIARDGSMAGLSQRKLMQQPRAKD